MTYFPKFGQDNLQSAYRVCLIQVCVLIPYLDWNTSQVGVVCHIKLYVQFLLVFGSDSVRVFPQLFKRLALSEIFISCVFFCYSEGVLYKTALFKFMEQGLKSLFIILNPIASIVKLFGCNPES